MSKRKKSGRTRVSRLIDFEAEHEGGGSGGDSGTDEPNEYELDSQAEAESDGDVNVHRNVDGRQRNADADRERKGILRELRRLKKRRKRPESPVAIADEAEPNEVHEGEDIASNPDIPSPAHGSPSRSASEGEELESHPRSECSDASSSPDLEVANPYADYSKPPPRQPPPPPPPSPPRTPPQSPHLIPQAHEQLQALAKAQMPGEEWMDEQRLVEFMGDGYRDSVRTATGISREMMDLQSQREDDETKAQQAEIVAKIRVALDTLLRMVGYRVDGPRRTLNHLLTAVFRLYPVDVRTSLATLETLQAIYQKTFNDLLSVVSSRVRSDAERESFLEDINRFHQAMGAIMMMRRGLSYHSTVLTDTFHSAYSLSVGLSIHYDAGGLNQFQAAIRMLMRAVIELRLRKYKSSVMEPIMVDGKYINAFKVVGTIDDWVRKHLRDPDMSRVLTETPNLLDQVISHLSKNEYHDPFTEVRKNYGYVAYRNGVFCLEDESFMTHREAIEKDIVAFRFFDVEINPAWITEYGGDFLTGNWNDFPNTQSYDRVFKYQWRDSSDETAPVECRVGNADEVIRWNYAFQGRLLWDVSERDKFQRSYILTGTAGTGKGAVTKVLSGLFEAEDRKDVMGGVGEKVFGMMGAQNAKLVIVNEMRDNFTDFFSESDFLLMTSGESVVIRNKHSAQSAVPRWTAPIVMIGNKIGFTVASNKSGEIARRLFWGVFRKAVPDDEKDSNIDGDVERDIPFIIIKLCKAYNRLLRYLRAKDVSMVDSLLPKYYKQVLFDWLAESNSLELFLQQEDQVKFGPDLYTPETVFRDKYFAFCEQNKIDLRIMSWQEKMYTDAFTRHRITGPKNERLAYPRDQNNFLTEKFIRGCDVADPPLRILPGNLSWSSR